MPAHFPRARCFWACETPYVCCPAAAVGAAAVDGVVDVDGGGELMQQMLLGA